MLALVFNLPHIQHCDFTIRCKKCGENIPAPVGAMSDFWIAAQWTERTPESIRRTSGIELGWEGWPSDFEEPGQLRHPPRTQTRDLCRDRFALRRAM
jgi:hypothetical protein